MLIAVLDRAGVAKLAGNDIYVSTMGGVRLNEPGADLAIALALASASQRQPVRPTSVAYGEVSLVGEIRGVTQQPLRATEAKRMGFGEVIDAEFATVHAAVGRALLPMQPHARRASRPTEAG